MSPFKKYLLLSVSFLCITLSTEAVYKRTNVSIKQVNQASLYFPKDFLFGFAIAEQQNSGEVNLPNSQWTRWEQTSWPDGTPHINNGARSGSSCDHWNLYKEDIRLMKQDFNANSFRFSVAWDAIEPQEGVFSEEALQHYSDEVDALLAAGMVPMITLHHFAHPVWFEDKGAFEKDENIYYFVRFAEKVFRKLGHKVPLWCTINEPGIYAFQGYLPLNCVFPPGKSRGKGDIDYEAYKLTATVIRNMMKAHVEVYRALKALPGGKEAQIGLVHQHLKFGSRSSWNPADKSDGTHGK